MMINRGYSKGIFTRTDRALALVDEPNQISSSSGKKMVNDEIN